MLDGFFNFLIEDFGRPGDSFDPSLSRPYCKVCKKDAWLSWCGSYSDYCSVACRDSDTDADMKKQTNNDLPLPPTKPSDTAEEAMKKLKAGVLSKLAAKDIKRKAQNLINQKQLARQRTVARFDDDDKVKQRARDEYVLQLKQEKSEADRLRQALEEEAASKLRAAVLEKEALRKKLDDTTTTAKNQMKNLERSQQQDEIARKLLEKEKKDKQKYIDKLSELQKRLNEAEKAALLAEKMHKTKTEAAAKEIADEAEEAPIMAAKGVKTEMATAKLKAESNLQANKSEGEKILNEKQLEESVTKLPKMSEEEKRRAENIKKLEKKNEIKKKEQEEKQKALLRKKEEAKQEASPKKMDEEQMTINKRMEEERQAQGRKEETQAQGRKKEEERQAQGSKKEEERQPQGRKKEEEGQGQGRKKEEERQAQGREKEEEGQAQERKKEEDRQAEERKKEEERQAQERKKEEERQAQKRKKEEKGQVQERKNEEERQAQERKKKEEKIFLTRKKLYSSQPVFALDFSRLGRPYCSNSVCGRRVSYKEFKDLYEEEEYRIWNTCSACQATMFKTIWTDMYRPSAIEINLPNSNFYELSINSSVPIAFPDFSVIWPTVKHLYEAQRFGNIKIQEEVRRCKSFDDISEITMNTPSKYIRDDWESYRFKAMRTCLFLRVEQHPRLQLLLSSTKCLPIYHQDWANEKDNVFSASIHVSVSGLNIVGKILMEKRNQLKMT